MVIATYPIAARVGEGELDQGFILKIVLSDRFVGHFSEKVELIGFTACPKVKGKIMACISLF